MALPLRVIPNVAEILRGKRAKPRSVATKDAPEKPKFFFLFRFFRIFLKKFIQDAIFYLHFLKFGV